MAESGGCARWGSLVTHGSVRFRDVSGRHRGHIWAEGGPLGVRRLRPGRGAAVLVGAVAVPGLLLGGVFTALRYESKPDRQPQSVARQVKPAGTQPARPKVYPTYGEYVPPRAARPVRPTTSPRPSRAVTPRPRRSAKRPTGPECPENWRYLPILRRWCERNGYRVD